MSQHLQQLLKAGSEDNVMNVSLLGRGGKVKISCRMFNVLLKV